MGIENMSIENPFFPFEENNKLIEYFTHLECSCVCISTGKSVSLLYFLYNQLLLQMELLVSIC